MIKLKKSKKLQDEYEDLNNKYKFCKIRVKLELHSTKDIKIEY